MIGMHNVRAALLSIRKPSICTRFKPKQSAKDSVKSLLFLAELNQSRSVCGKVKLELTLGLGSTGPS